VTVGGKARYSQPYWRKNPRLDRWDYDVPQDQLLPWSPPDLVAELSFEAAGAAARLEMPAYHRYEGRWVGGEKQKLLNVVPALSVELTPEILVIPTSTAKQRRELRAVVLNNGKGAAAATLRLQAPAGWAVEPAETPVQLRYEGEQVSARFFVTPPAGLKPGDYDVRAIATKDGEEFRDGYQVIAYDHIQERHLFHPAEAHIKGVDVKLDPGMYVGYVRGAGDEVEDAIEQLGFKLEFLNADDLAYGDLGKYTTIVTGIRAYQTRPDLRAHHGRLMRWVEQGGHLVVQYNKLDFNQLQERATAGGFSGQQPTSGKPPDSPWAPYPGASVGTGRVTDENAPLTVLLPDHPLLTTPNRLTGRDFEGWVQERGLYFLDVRDVRYKDLLAASDPFPNNAGEKRGLLVEAQVGKGSWTYVGLGLFRQAAAGVDGAYRILANLVARPRPKG
jgi:hypothetical protein